MCACSAGPAGLVSNVWSVAGRPHRMDELRLSDGLRGGPMDAQVGCRAAQAGAQLPMLPTQEGQGEHHQLRVPVVHLQRLLCGLHSLDRVSRALPGAQSLSSPHREGHGVGVGVRAAEIAESPHALHNHSSLDKTREYRRGCARTAALPSSCDTAALPARPARSLPTTTSGVRFGSVLEGSPLA